MNPRLIARWWPCAAVLFAFAGCAPKVVAPEPIRAVRTMVVGEAGSGSPHDYAAEIRARTESRLSFRVGGKLATRLVNSGDMVRAGQLLARLDPTDLRLGLDAASAAQRAAQTNLEQLEADFRRYRELREQGFIGPAELERRDAAVKAARAQLEQANAQASAQGNQAAYASLVADSAGVITAVEAEPGQVLAAGTPVLKLAQDGPRDAQFSVPEDVVDQVRALLGKPDAARLQLWGAAATTPATLREVAGAADPVTRTFLVKADVGRRRAAGPDGHPPPARTACGERPATAAHGCLRGAGPQPRVGLLAGRGCGAHAGRADRWCGWQHRAGAARPEGW